jgi:hypothetical protein
MGVHLSFVAMVLAHPPSRALVIAAVLAEGTCNSNFWAVSFAMAIQVVAFDGVRAQLAGHRRLTAFVEMVVHLVKAKPQIAILAIYLTVSAQGDVKIPILPLDFLFAAPVVGAFHHLIQASFFVGSEVVHLTLPVAPFGRGFVGILELLDKVCLLSIGLKATSFQLCLELWDRFS